MLIQLARQLAFVFPKHEFLVEIVKLELHQALFQGSNMVYWRFCWALGNKTLA